MDSASPFTVTCLLQRRKETGRSQRWRQNLQNANKPKCSSKPHTATTGCSVPCSPSAARKRCCASPPTSLCPANKSRRVPSSSGNRSLSRNLTSARACFCCTSRVLVLKRTLILIPLEKCNAGTATQTRRPLQSQEGRGLHEPQAT